jgi:hypothetical protein
MFISQGGQVVNLDNLKPIYSNGLQVVDGDKEVVWSISGVVRVYSF